MGRLNGAECNSCSDMLLALSRDQASVVDTHNSSSFFELWKRGYCSVET